MTEREHPPEAESARQPDERPVVSTVQAAHALHLQPVVFGLWADRGLVTPDATDADGTRWWNLHDLRRELAKYLTDED